jgi:hypothetical protein
MMDGMVAGCEFVLPVQPNIPKEMSEIVRMAKMVIDVLGISVSPFLGKPIRLKTFLWFNVSINGVAAPDFALQSNLNQMFRCYSKVS